MAHLTDQLNAIFALNLEDHDKASLARWLYDHCYAQSILAPVSKDRTTGQDNLLATLIAANHSKASWVEGWQIDQVLTKGSILAGKNGGLRTFAAGEYISSRGPGCGPAPEGPVMVFRISESQTLQPAYYYAFGETICPFAGSDMLRFYWNIPAQHAPKLMACLTRGMDRFQVPFSLKFPKKATSYARRDTAVLYTHRWYYPITALVLEAVYQDVAACLRPDTPLFTRQLAPGLGFAEDPGESFGEHRCRILARALLNSSSEPFGALQEAFRHEGLSLDRPWLNAESRDDYAFPDMSA